MDNKIEDEIAKAIAKGVEKNINEHKLKEIKELMHAWEFDREIFKKLKEIKTILEERLKNEPKIN